MPLSKTKSMPVWGARESRPERPRVRRAGVWATSALKAASPMVTVGPAGTGVAVGASGVDAGGLVEVADGPTCGVGVGGCGVGVGVFVGTAVGSGCDVGVGGLVGTAVGSGCRVGGCGCGVRVGAAVGTGGVGDGTAVGSGCRVVVGAVVASAIAVGASKVNT